jgi:hypothetical protein
MKRQPLTFIATTNIGSAPVSFKFSQFFKWLDCKELREYNVPTLLKELSEFAAFEENRQQLHTPVATDLDTYKSRHIPHVEGIDLSNQDISWNNTVINRTLKYLEFNTRFSTLENIGVSSDEEAILFQVNDITYDIRSDRCGFSSYVGGLRNADWDQTIAFLLRLKDALLTDESNSGT